MALGQDPTWLAYMRALGFEEGEATANAEQSRGQVEDRLAFQRPIVAEQGEMARRGISAGFESRGVFRSGGHETALAEQRRGEQEQVGALELDAANDVAGITGSLAQEIVRLRRQQTERDMDISQRQALDAALAGLA